MGQSELNTQDYTKHKVQFFKAFQIFFGAKGKKVDPVMLDGYWHALGNYPIDLLSKALDNLALEDNAFMPDAGKIISEIKSIRGQDSAAHHRSTPHYCDICNNTGMVIIKKMHNGTAYETAYACRCPNGQRVDQRIRVVPEEYMAALNAPEAKLPMVTLETLATIDPDHVWEDGVDVAKLCAECRKPYVMRHERRVTAKELQDFHINTTRPPQCEPCYREMGRRAGMWL